METARRCDTLLAMALLAISLVVAGASNECENLPPDEWPPNIRENGKLLGGCDVIESFAFLGVRCDVDMSGIPIVQQYIPGSTGRLDTFCCKSCVKCGASCYEGPVPDYDIGDDDGDLSESISNTVEICGANYTSNSEILTCGRRNATIPTKIGLLTGLKLFAWTGKTDSLPTEIGLLTKLTYLLLSNTRYNGTIPTEIGRLTQLSTLNFFRNSIEGTVPTEIGRLQNIELLSVENNRLTGTIPTEIAELPNVITLALNANNLTGTLPPGMSMMRTLKTLRLDSNNFEGVIPDFSLFPFLTIMQLNSSGLEKKNSSEPCPAGSSTTFEGTTTLCQSAFNATSLAYEERCDLTFCFACPAGKQRTANSIAKKCLPCPLGTYCPIGSDDENRSCGMGRYCPHPSYELELLPGYVGVDLKGAPAPNGGAIQSIPCEPGRYCKDGIDQGACDYGTFQAAGGRDKCDECPPGRYGDETGLAECKPCAAGTSSDGGRDACETCSKGRWSAAGSPACTACAVGRFGNTSGLGDEGCTGICPPGTHSPSNATMCTPCGKETYSSLPEQERCTACDDRADLTSSIGATECVCEVGKFLNDRGECKPCVEGMDCSAIGSTVASLKLQSGYWRSNDETETVFECNTESSCVGDGNCSKGSQGVLCSICAEGYFRIGTRAPCTKCGNPSRAIASAIGIGFAMVVVLIIFIRINRRAPNGLIRPFIELVRTRLASVDRLSATKLHTRFLVYSAFQVQKATVMLMFNAPFPSALIWFRDWLLALQFGVELVSPQCIGWSYDFYSLFGYTVALLVLLIFATMLPLLVEKFRKGWTWKQVKHQSKQVQKTFRDIFVLVLLVHPALSGRAMQFFRCREIEGELFLVADYSQKCYDSRWWSFFPLVLVVFVFFSLGTPVAIVYVLRKKRHNLYDRSGYYKPQPLDILFALYREEAYWYEAVLMVFKLMLWATLVFFPYGAELPLATALVVNVLQLCVHLMLLPYGGEEAMVLNRIYAATLVLITCKRAIPSPPRILCSLQLKRSVTANLAPANINFGGLCLKYLEIAQKLATFVNVSAVGSYDRRISAIKIVMEILFYSMFAAFGLLGIAYTYSIAKHTRMGDVRAQLEAELPRKSTMVRFKNAIINGDLKGVMNPRMKMDESEAAVDPSSGSSRELSTTLRAIDLVSAPHNGAEIELKGVNLESQASRFHESVVSLPEDGSIYTSRPISTRVDLP